MTGLIILSMVGCSAVVVLVACLKGFSKASRHRKIEKAFVTVEKNRGRFSERRTTGLIDFPQRKPGLPREPATHQVCAGTAALVEMAIILGSRNIYTGVPAGSRDPEGADSGATEGPRGGTGRTTRSPKCNR